MGFWKRQMEHEFEVGYRDPDKLVCARHFDSPFVVALVEEGAQPATCDYCGRSGAADLDIVLDAMSTVLWDYWDHAVNQLGWSSADGGYQGFHCDVEDAVEELFGGLTDNDDLWADLLEAWLPETVCKSNAYGFSTDEALAFDWEQFVDETRSRTRYVFLVDLNARPEDADSALPYPDLADGILGQVAALARDHDLLVPMPAGTRWVRSRVHGASERLDLPEGLCSPPSAVSVANRMSPAGISMFYGAKDELTALAETSQPGRRGRVATVGTFETTEDMIVLDLTRLPPMPEIFDLAQRRRYEELRFLRDFTRDLSAPVAKDGREHVEYVPTQIVTEYFRRVVRHGEDEIGGLVYRSSPNPDGVCAVLFADHKACLAGRRWPDRQLLQLDRASVAVRADAGRTVAALARRRRSRRRRF